MPGARAEGRAASSQCLLKDHAVFSLGAPTVACGLALQRLDHFAGNISDQQLGHARMLSHDSNACNDAPHGLHERRVR